MTRDKIALTIMVILTMMSLPAYADESAAGKSKLELGLSTNVPLGDGESSNSALGFGVIGRYYLNDGWFTGATVDSYDIDFENTAELVAVAPDADTQAVDALATNTVVSGFVGRLYGAPDTGFDWFWSAGVGIGFPEISGFNTNMADGDSFALSLDRSAKVHLMGSIGTSYRFTPTWSATFAARLEHHFSDVTATDSASGISNTLDAGSPLGAYFSVDYRF